jgi:hypothetical protein
MKHLLKLYHHTFKKNIYINKNKKTIFVKIIIIKKTLFFSFIIFLFLLKISTTLLKSFFSIASKNSAVDYFYIFFMKNKQIKLRFFTLNIVLYRINIKNKSVYFYKQNFSNLI